MLKTSGAYIHTTKTKMVFQKQWWCPPEEYADVQDDWFIRFFTIGCSQYEEVDSNKICVYSVFGNDLLDEDKDDDDDTVRFLFVGENTSILPDHPWYDRVDAILTFFPETPKSIRMPLWTIYWRFDEDGLFPIAQNLPTHRKDRAVIIVSHDNSKNRNVICQKVLREYRLPVDSSLDTLSHTHLIPAPARGVHYKMETLAKYRYNICPENSYRPGYVTEKVFQALAGGCVPIYWGPMPVEPRVLHQSPIMDIHAPFRPNVFVDPNGVWTPDAILHIFATYLKVWSTVVRKLCRGKRPRADIPTVTYECSDQDACVRTLAEHWRTHRRFWSPRALFVVRTPSPHDPQRVVVHHLHMEDIANTMYEQYHL